MPLQVQKRLDKVILQPDLFLSVHKTCPQNVHATVLLAMMYVWCIYISSYWRDFHKAEISTVFLHR